jgi:hypothetical protein
MPRAANTDVVASTTWDGVAFTFRVNVWVSGAKVGPF